MAGFSRSNADPDGAAGPIKVLLVDDNHSFLESTLLLLATEPEITVMGLASGGEQAIALARSLKPDVVVMDITMQGMSGLEASRRIKGWIDAPTVIILSLHTSADYREAATATGAERFIAKNDVGDELVPAIVDLFHQHYGERGAATAVDEEERPEHREAASSQLANPGTREERRSTAGGDQNEGAARQPCEAAQAPGAGVWSERWGERAGRQFGRS